MDNICLLGIGLFGLLLLTKKSEKETEKTIMTIYEKGEKVSTYVDSQNSDEMTIAKQLATNKYMQKTDTGVEWVIPKDEVSENDLHPFIGLDYLKINMDTNLDKTIGRYMVVEESAKEMFKMIIPSLEYSTQVVHNNETLTLVKNIHKSIGVSVIIINFVENINTELTICEIKKIYKKVLKNYTCKNKIEPAVEWFNSNLLDESTNLYSDLCGTDETSALETEQVLDTDLMGETDTSMDDNNEDLDDESETSMDDDENLDDVDDSETSMDDEKLDDIVLEESDTSLNNENLDDVTDTGTSEVLDTETIEPKKISKDLLGEGSINDINIDELSNTSEDMKSPQNKAPSPKKNKAPSPKKKKAPSPKKKKAASKKRSGKKGSGKKKTSGGKKKKSKKINLNSSDLEISGGSSSSLSNTKKSILGRF